MRLRRESGDFSIKIASDDTVEFNGRKGLNAESFIGAIITTYAADNSIVSHELVTKVSVSNGVYTLTAGDSTYTYDVATGEFDAVS